MMKKILTALLALCLLFGCCACAAKEPIIDDRLPCDVTYKDKTIRFYKVYALDFPTDDLYNTYFIMEIDGENLTEKELEKFIEKDLEMKLIFGEGENEKELKYRNSMIKKQHYYACFTIEPEDATTESHLGWPVSASITVERQTYMYNFKLDSQTCCFWGTCLPKELTQLMLDGMEIAKAEKAEA